MEDATSNAIPLKRARVVRPRVAVEGSFRARPTRPPELAGPC